MLRPFQEFTVMCITVAHGKAVKCPSLTTTPNRLVVMSLKRHLTANTAILGVIVNHMVCGVVGSEMILQCAAGMTESYVVKMFVAR